MSKVCIVRHNYYPDEPRVRRDAESLIEHGYEVDVICLRKKGQKKRECINNVNVYRLAMEHHRKGIMRYIYEYSVFTAMVSCLIGWLFLRRRYRVIEVVSMPEFLILATLFPKLLGTRVILHIFDFTSVTFAQAFKVSRNHVIAKLLTVISKLCYTLADHIIVCEYLGQELLWTKGVRKSKITVVLNVPDENVFTSKSYSANVIGQQGYFYLITHGSILERYGVQTLIRAVPLLIDNIPELRIMVVGDGEYRPQLEELAQSLGISEYIHFTGFVPFEEIPSLINQAAIGVVSCLTPMLPNKLFEYLASGTPTVAAKTRAISTFLDDKSVALYEPDDEQGLANCVLDLYRNPQKRAVLAASGLTIYKKYRWDQMKHEYLKIFKQLTAHLHALPEGVKGDT